MQQKRSSTFRLFVARSLGGKVQPGEVAEGSALTLTVDLTEVRTGGTLEVTGSGLGTTGTGLGSGMDVGCAETVGLLRTSEALGIKPARGTKGDGFGTGTLFGAGMNPGGGEIGDLIGEEVAGEVGGENAKVFSSGFKCVL